DVAQSTIQSPRDIEYVSEVRTEEARKAAESAVLPVYSSPDPAIARQQIGRLRTTLQNITAVRNSELTPAEKRTSILALSDIRLKVEPIDFLIGISDPRWDTVQTESLRVLETIMRRAIYEDRLEATQSAVSSSVSLVLSEQQAM